VKVKFGPYVIEYDDQGHRKSVTKRTLLKDGKDWVKTKDGWRRKDKEDGKSK